MDMEKSVNGLWIGESLSTLQIISINSWIKNGFEFNLYTYENVKNVPLDVNLKGAASAARRGPLRLHRGATTHHSRTDAAQA